METLIASLRLRVDSDTSLARQKVREASNWCGFSPLEQTRLMSSLSEVARVLVSQPEEATFSLVLTDDWFLIRLQSSSQTLTEKGLESNLVTPRRLLDRVRVVEGQDGLTVEMAKNLTYPLELQEALRCKLALEGANDSGAQVVRQQNYELQEALELLRRKDQQLRQNLHELRQLNEELASTQTQLVQSEKMASLGQLVAGIAHEFNNPLTFIRGNLHSVQNWLQQLRPAQSVLAGTPEQLRLWDKIGARTDSMASGLERMRFLVEKLRTFSRLDESSFKAIDVHETVESVLVLVNHRLGDGVEVERQYRYVGTLMCFPGPLNQVIMSLITNALDAMADRGKLVVGTRAEHGFFILRLEDTGCGIPEPSLGKVFEPFFTTKPVGQGTGLGLAICYSIMQAHHGSIEIESTVGVGTSVELRIPLDLDVRVKAVAPK